MAASNSLAGGHSQHQAYRAARRGGGGAGCGQRPRCISCLTLRFDSGTTKHRRNAKSNDPNHNLIVKRADPVMAMLRFPFAEPIPSRSDRCQANFPPVAWTLISETATYYRTVQTFAVTDDRLKTGRSNYASCLAAAACACCWPSYNPV
jgi:hypothetical protein